MSVTTRAVVWIEIMPETDFNRLSWVTTRAVVWIEIIGHYEEYDKPTGHHPCGGVD